MSLLLYLFFPRLGADGIFLTDGWCIGATCGIEKKCIVQAYCYRKEHPMSLPNQGYLYFVANGVGGATTVGLEVLGIGLYMV